MEYFQEFQKISNNTSMSQEQALRIFQHCDKVRHKADDDITIYDFIF